MTFTLINARPSPYGRKVAIALLEKSLAYTVEYDVPWGQDSCTGKYSPLQQLPILIAADGEVVYDSTYILEWLEVRYPDPPLLPRDPDRRLDAKLRQLLGERLLEAAQAAVFELNRPRPSEAWLERQTRKVEGVLAELEARAPERLGRTAAELDLGDIAIGSTLLVFEFIVPAGLSPDIEAIRWRGRYPALTRYVSEMERRPSFQATAPAPMDVDLRATVV